MDPYLENAAGWLSFHNPYLSDIADALNAALPNRYVARVDERCYILNPKRPFIPDVSIKRRPAKSMPRGHSGGVATLSRQIDPALIVRLEPFDVREWFVNVLDLEQGERIVTCIELLSPTNKASGGVGRSGYRRKQRELTATRTSLLEVDLLRGGEHTVVADRDLLNMEKHWDYVACLHRGGARREVEAWAWSIRETMPTVAVPLSGEDEDLPLDLQDLINHRYDAGAHGKSIDYSENPIPPLRAEDAAWADALLRKARLR